MTVELLSYFGSDIMVVNTARVSFQKEASNYTEEQNAKLINYLFKHGHTSCFRHPQLHFRIKCPIYVERQIFKHQVGISVNSISGRYVDFSDSYYSINTWRKQSKSSKQGSEGLVENQNRANEIQKEVVELCKVRYKELLELGVAKEQARSILTLSLETQFIWTGSLLAFLHLCNLRIKENVQEETREIAQKMLDQVKAIPGNPFKYTLQAFGF